MKKNSKLMLICALWMLMVLGALALPAFGSFPSRGEALESVATYYLENGVPQTGALNIVSTIVWDYRGYDTMGEITILFATVCGVMALLRRSGDL